MNENISAEESSSRFLFVIVFLLMFVLRVSSSLSVADKERSRREEVRPLSLQLSADLQSHVAEDRLSTTVLVRQESRARLSER